VNAYGERDKVFQEFDASINFTVSGFVCKGNLPKRIEVLKF